MSIQNRKVYEWHGKHYLRLGECNRCGECCLGWGQGPCPYLSKQSHDHFTCTVYEQRPGLAALEGWCNPAACVTFPDGPGDLSHLAFQNKCTYYFVEVEKMLVACATYEGKEYAAERWLEAVKNLDYPAYDLLWVDNSTTPDFYHRWKDKIPMVRLELPNETGFRRTGLSMEYIRKHFLASNYDRWLNLEADVIVPSETILTMLSYDHQRRLDWLGFSYPSRETQDPGYAAFGCTMFSRKLMERHDFTDCPSDNSTDGWWWSHKVKFDTEVKVAEFWGTLQLEHPNA